MSRVQHMGYETGGEGGQKKGMDEGDPTLFTHLLHARRRRKRYGTIDTVVSMSVFLVKYVCTISS